MIARLRKAWQQPSEPSFAGPGSWPGCARGQYEQGLAGEPWHPYGYGCRDEYVAGLMRRSRVRRLVRAVGDAFTALSERVT